MLSAFCASSSTRSAWARSACREICRSAKLTCLVTTRRNEISSGRHERRRVTWLKTSR